MYAYLIRFWRGEWDGARDHVYSFTYDDREECEKDMLEESAGLLKEGCRPLSFDIFEYEEVDEDKGRWGWRIYDVEGPVTDGRSMNHEDALWDLENALLLYKRPGMVKKVVIFKGKDV